MADTEELRLVVSLTDNASAQLTAIRGSIQSTFGPSATGQLDQFTRKSDETTRKMRELAEATTSVGKAVDFFTRGFGAAGIAIGAVGYAINAQLRNLKEYSETMTRLGNTAASLGATVAAVRNVQEAFQRHGHTIEDANRAMERLQKQHADLLRPGNELANRLLSHTRTPEQRAAMEQYIDGQRRALHYAQEINAAQAADERIRQNALKARPGDEIFAAQQVKNFNEMAEIENSIADLHEQILDPTAEQVKLQDMLVTHAQNYNAELARASQGWTHLLDLFKDKELGPDGPFGKLLDKINSTLDRSAASGLQAQRETQGMTGAEEFGYLPPFYRNLLPSWLAPYFATPNTIVKGRFGEMQPPAADQGLGGALGHTGGAQFFTGGGARYGTAFGQPGWRLSSNIEDARGRSGGDLMDENNRQLKLLNDQLFEMLHPAGAGGGNGGLGLLSAGGGLGGGGLGGGGAIRIPPGAGGGTAPYGSHVGPGTGAGAGETSPHGALGGQFDMFTSGVGAAGGGLAADRARYAKELENNPALRQKVMRIAYNEQGANPQGTQAVIESMMNRASARGTSLEQAARWYRGEPGGYYEMGNMGRGALENAHSRAVLEDALKNALGGSNISNYATDNSSGGLAARERATGKFIFASGYHGETFFTPGSAEPDRARQYQHWRQALADNDRDRATMDAHAVQTHRVEGTGKLTANISAPKGTDVTLEGGGIFRKIEINRVTQMTPASNSPAIRD